MSPKYNPFDLSTPSLNGKLNIHENLMVRKLVPSYISDCEMAPGSTFSDRQKCVDVLDQTWNICPFNLSSLSQLAAKTLWEDTTTMPPKRGISK